MKALIKKICSVGGFYKTRNGYIVYMDYPYYISINIYWLGDDWCPFYTGMFNYTDYTHHYPELCREDDPKHETMVSVYKLAVKFMWGY